MLEVVSSMTAYELYHEEKEYCEQNKIRIGSKNTIMEYTKKIGFLVGTYVRVASPKYYIDELSKILKTSAKVIDIKKGFTFEKGLRTKALIVYAIEREAQMIDEILNDNVRNKRYRYISYRNSPSQEKLAAMHYNDMANVKAKYETLYNINLNDEVMYENNESVTLEKALMDEKINGHNLFLAAEQGSGKFENDVTVIINPRMKVEAWKWLSEEYGKWEVYQDKEMMTSVDPDKCKGSWKYNESLKEFLKPTLQNVNFKKNKYGKRIKTYAQVVGINIDKNEPKPQDRSKEKSVKIVTEIDNKSDETLLSVIQGMKEQINALQKIITVLCNTIVKDEGLKQEVMEKMNQINSKSEKVEESKVSEKKGDTKVEIDKLKNQINKGKRKDVEIKHDIQRIITHPNTLKDVSGNINNEIRSWYRSTKETDDQKITDDHKVKKLRQQ